MDAAMDSLTKEVERIVTAPYLVSLKYLHDILEDVETPALRKWADANISHIPSLATAILGNLTLWPYTWRIVERLASVTEIRDTLLFAEPNLLDNLLQKATQTDEGYEHFAPACISLLLERLPGEVALPSSSQTFFRQVFARAVRDPAVDTVEPVYNLLCGACHGLPDILPQRDLDEFRNQLTKMMRSVKSVNDQLLSLLCLSIIADINRGHKEDPGSTTDTIVDTPKQSTASTSAHSREDVQKFFTGDKAPKTLHLVTLQVVYACQGKASVPKSWALKHVTTSRRILSAISSELRFGWAKSNAMILKKLIEKTLQNNLDLDVQLEALAFLSMLCDVQVLPSNACTVLQNILLNVSSLTLNERRIDDLLSSILPYFAPRISHEFYADLLRQFLQLGATTSNSDYGVLRAVEPLARQLKNLVVENREARTGVINAVSSIQLSGLLHQFLACSHTLKSVQLENNTARLTSVHRSAVISLILEATLSTQSDEAGLQLHLARQLVQLHQHLILVQRSAHETTVFRHGTAARIDLCPSKTAQGASHQWREKLSIEMCHNFQSHEKSVIEFVGSVCQDFERRCDTVEQPLREEQEMHNVLKRKFDDLQKHAQDLEATLNQTTSDFKQLQKAKSCVDDELTEAASEVQRLSQQVADLDEKFIKEQEQYSYNLQEARRVYEREELDLRTTIACHVDEIDEKTVKIRDLEMELESLQAYHTTEMNQAQNTLTLQRKSVEDSETKIESLKKDIARLRSDNEDTHEALKEKDRKVDQLTKDAEGSMNEIKRLEHDFKEFEQAKYEEVRQLREKNEADVHLHEEKLAAAQQEMDDRSEDAARNLSELREQSEEDKRTMKHAIEKLQRKLQHSHREYEDKNRQLEEVMSMKSKLLKAMGITEPESGLQNPPPMVFDEEEDLVAQSSTQAVCRTSVATDHQQDKGFTSPRVQSSTSEEAPQSRGPSPKRAKPRTIFKVPTMAQPGKNPQSRSLRSHQDRLSLGRIPMADASIRSMNRSPRKHRRWSEDSDAIELEKTASQVPRQAPVQLSLSPLEEMSQAEKENAAITSSASGISQLDIHEDDFDATATEL